MSIIVSIDPGLTGAMACLGRNHAHVADLPVIDTGLDKWLDGRGIYDQLLAWVPIDERCLLIVENVRPRAQGNGGRAANSMHSQGSMMRSRGVIECVASIARIEITWVMPQRWKKHFSLARDDGDTDSAVKEKSRQMALRLFPAMGEALKYKNSHNRAESLLMAHWGRSTQL